MSSLGMQYLRILCVCTAGCIAMGWKLSVVLPSGVMQPQRGFLEQVAGHTVDLASDEMYIAFLLGNFQLPIT